MLVSARLCTCEVCEQVLHVGTQIPAYVLDTKALVCAHYEWVCEQIVKM